MQPEQTPAPDGVWIQREEYERLKASVPVQPTIYTSPMSAEPTKRTTLQLIQQLAAIGGAILTILSFSTGLGGALLFPAIVLGAVFIGISFYESAKHRNDPPVLPISVQLVRQEGPPTSLGVKVLKGLLLVAAGVVATFVVLIALFVVLMIVVFSGTGGQGS